MATNDDGNRMFVMGMMSGTSMDGIDCAIVEFAKLEGRAVDDEVDDVRGSKWLPLARPPAPLSPLGASHVRLVAYSETPYAAETLQALRGLVEGGAQRALEVVGAVCRANAAVGEAFARAAVELLAAVNEDTGSRVALVASHGQTIFHYPERVDQVDELADAVSTLQIGEPARIAVATGLPVIADFRQADMAVGGAGAPLIPFVDAVLFRDVEGLEARVLVNLGGIANVSLVSPRSADLLLAYDTGPANMLVDELVRAAELGVCDEGGAIAACGTPSSEAVDAVLAAEPFFAAAPPKATGRELFGAAFLNEVLKPAFERATGCDAESANVVADLVATATLLSARSLVQSVAAASRDVPGFAAGGPVLRLICSGGGVHNASLMSMIASEAAAELGSIGWAAVHVDDVSQHTGCADFASAKEAIGFAILGYASLHLLPSNVPSATGARRPAILGTMTYPPP
ncbi:anhydro-N-acetylmuramic acid kinase [Thecamonas trahens ATCC 50062]|uniref:Anhydro-N-acetylmuramic acid kinase n=1 Tax=Thecamonas trahens ATCC 50062 TaxID=461836 RepID=A0A0L0D7U2_THETB|nr:anhydro-N-acetylmuramic acid kinase [Thecamonas trahens ATCC 50062]KNC48131.1 anhydro-N-acetylmuramic acid kinase [Thecamonas trahens ATCC 50062]|eukprot:XP_013758702.1 anhydro-N-acetylmuramic acid kinase [Thecamonas trahens ATCC 50062]